MGMAIAQVWGASQVLIGPAARARLMAGEPLRIAEGQDVREVGRPSERIYTFRIAPARRPNHVCVEGRLEPDGSWQVVDGPWRADAPALP